MSTKQRTTSPIHNVIYRRTKSKGDKAQSWAWKPRKNKSGPWVKVR